MPGTASAPRVRPASTSFPSWSRTPFRNWASGDLTIGDSTHGGLPERGHVRPSRDLRKNFDERTADRRGYDLPAAPLDEGSVEERLDDGGLRGGRADTVGLSKDLLDLGILHVACDAGHRLDETRLSELLGGRGMSLGDRHVGAPDLLALSEKRRRAAGFLALRRSSVLIGLDLRNEGAPPFRDRLAPRRTKALTLNCELDLRLVVFECGMELGEVTARDEIVDPALGRRQDPNRLGHDRRNDGVMGRDLLVVPSARALGSIGGAGGRHERRDIRGDSGEHGYCLIVLSLR